MLSAPCTSGSSSPSFLLCLFCPPPFPVTRWLCPLPLARLCVSGPISCGSRPFSLRLVVLCCPSSVLPDGGTAVHVLPCRLVVFLLHTCSELVLANLSASSVIYVFWALGSFGSSFVLYLVRLPLVLLSFTPSLGPGLWAAFLALLFRQVLQVGSIGPGLCIRSPVPPVSPGASFEFHRYSFLLFVGQVSFILSLEAILLVCSNGVFNSLIHRNFVLRCCYYLGIIVPQLSRLSSSGYEY